MFLQVGQAFEWWNFKMTEDMYVCILDYGKQQSIVSPLRSNGQLVSDSHQKAEILNKQFSDVFTSENT